MSVIVYGWHGNVAWGTAALVAIASIFTARIGARLTTRFSPHGLAKVFAVFLFLVAIRLLWKVPEPTAAVFHSGPAAIWFDIYDDYFDYIANAKMRILRPLAAMQ